MYFLKWKWKLDKEENTGVCSSIESAARYPAPSPAAPSPRGTGTHAADSHRWVGCVNKLQAMRSMGCICSCKFRCTCWKDGKASTFLAGDFIWDIAHMSDIASSRAGTMTCMGCHWCQAQVMLEGIQTAKKTTNPNITQISNGFWEMKVNWM